MEEHFATSVKNLTTSEGMKGGKGAAGLVSLKVGSCVGDDSDARERRMPWASYTPCACKDASGRGERCVETRCV